MNLRKHLRAPSPDPDPATVGGGDPPPVTPSAPVRPEGLGDQYWDPEKGVKYDALLPILKQHEDYQALIPQKPEDIDWTLPTDLDPDNPNAVYEISKDDPLVAAVTEIALQEKAPKPLLNKLAGAFARVQIAQAKEAMTALKAEEKKLGDKFQERIAGAQAYVESVVGKEKAERFRSSWVTAEQVEIIEALAKKASGPTAADTTNNSPDANAADPQTRARVFFGKN